MMMPEAPITPVIPIPAIPEIITITPIAVMTTRFRSSPREMRPLSYPSSLTIDIKRE
jgi:hypothetical protein